MGAAADVPGWPMAKSALGELALLAATGAVFGLLALPLLTTSISLPAAVAAFAVAVCLAAYAARQKFGRHAVRALASYCGFLAVSGALFVALVELVSAQPEGLGVPLVSAAGAYVLAWLVGFLTPGAPAGLGVRELALLFLLKGIVNEADLLFAAVLWRGITVGGDVLFFGLGSFVRSKQ